MSIPRYDLVDLRLFVCIAEEANLTRGAGRAGISVGAASMRIKHLEQALGTPLLVRHSQGVSLTQAGEALLFRARRVFRELERLHGDLQAFSAGLKGQIRIFANTTAITGILPAGLGTFLAAHPFVDIDLEERLSPEIARAVTDGTVDIGILAGSTPTDDLEVIPYQEDRLALAVPAGHSLADAGDTDFSAVAHENFVSLHRGSAIHGFLDRIATDLGVTLNIRTHVSGFESLCRMVEAGAGIGVLPQSVASRARSSHHIGIVGLRDPWAVRELKICVQKFDELPAFARQLVDHLTRSAAT
ncbi:MAG: LysR family transcriptional regulator [Rhizobiaceae bacterium]|nr:LysR family transcriptional regulator [Rhizobiaceae bacterium]